jgi:fructose-bisphosphate aldolase class II
VPLAATGDLVARAAAAHTAVAAFNVITLEHVEAVVTGAEQAGAPVVVQVSENAVKYRGGRLLPLARAARAAAEQARVPVALHLDHVQSDDLLRQAPAAGFGSVMYDASRLPYARNLAATRAAVDWAHAQGLWIEAELGRIGGKDRPDGRAGAAGHAPDAHSPAARTDPDEARAFVTASGVDALAVAVGSAHAMTTRTARLDQDLVARLATAAGVPLVLHGSSGVPDRELAEAAARGIAKVNVGTALNRAMTEAVRDFLAAHPDVVDPRRYLDGARQAMARTVEHFLGVLGVLGVPGVPGAEPAPPGRVTA